MGLSGTVNDNKGLTKGYQPLLLVVITFHGTNTKLLLSTHPFDGIAGPTYPGVGSVPSGTYVGRLQKQDIEAIQYRSTLGLDRIPRVTLHVIDTDSHVYRNYARAYGFRGATMQLALIMWEPNTGNFSSDAPIVFQGTCDMEYLQQGGDILVVSANTSHNTALVTLPNDPLGKRCPKVFPSNHAERLAAAFDRSSPFYACGYSADISGGCGNTGPVNHTNGFGDQVTDSSGIFIMCDYIRSNPDDPTSGCMARLGNASGTSVAPDGDIWHDIAGHWTGRFGGIQWSPGTYYAITNNYTANQKLAVFSFLNSAIWGQYATILYGTQWVDAKIANIVESGNDTKFEAVICQGDIGTSGILKVLVNGIEITQAPSGDSSLFWSWANSGGNYSTGGRNGVPVTGLLGYNDSSHNALGDPFGSLARIVVCVYKDIFTGSGLPTCRILATGPKILRTMPIVSATASGGVITVTVPDVPDFFGDGSVVTIKGNSLANGTWTTSFASPPYTSFTLTGSTGTGTVTGGWVVAEGFSTSPVECLLDLMVRANWTTEELGIQSFYDTAKVGKVQISYQDQMGNTQTHERYKCQWAISEQKTAGELFAMLIRNFNGFTYYDQQGLLCVGSAQTLADAQPAAVPGSNYNTGISSIHADGSPGTGYVAYDFDESNCEYVESQALPNAQMPNRVFCQFQDEDNQFVVDSLADADPNAITRAGGALQPSGAITPETLTVGGLCNFDQASRVSNVFMAERNYANEANDPRGPRVVIIHTSVQAWHLRTGHIVRWSWQRFGVTHELYRVLEVQPSMNYEDMTITMQLHLDVHYTDAYGQQPQAFYSDPGTQRPERAPLPWQPNKVTPNVPSGRAYPDLSATELNFAVAEVDGVNAKGDPMVTLRVTGQPPIDRIDCLVQPPLVPVQASIGSGSIPAGTYIIELCATDVNDNTSAPSASITAVIPQGTTGSITINRIGWDAATENGEVFIGTNRFNVTHQQTVTSPGASLTITSIPNVLTFAPPDLAADTMFVEAREAIHTGIIGSTVVARTASPNTITIGAPPSGTFTNTLTGYKLTILGKFNISGVDMPLIEFDIVSHSGSVLTVDRDPTTLVSVGDVVSITAQANIHSPTTIGDSNFVSAYSTGVDASDVGMLVLINRGKGRGQVRNIKAVASGTTYTIDHAWTVEPDSTSGFIVIEPSPRWVSDGTVIRSTSYVDQVLPLLQVDNLANKPLFVSVIIGDPTQTKFSNEFRSPFRLIWTFGTQGTRTITIANAASPGMLPTDRILLFDTSGATQPSPDSLAANIDAVQTNVTVTTGTASVTGTVVQIGSERMFINAGGGTTSWTVTRGWGNTPTASHSAGATVTLPGKIDFTVLPIDGVFNQSFLFRKVSTNPGAIPSTDINYVRLLPTGTDLFPDGSSQVLLVDDSTAYGTLGLVAPEA